MKNFLFAFIFLIIFSSCSISTKSPQTDTTSKLQESKQIEKNQDKQVSDIQKNYDVDNKNLESQVEKTSLTSINDEFSKDNYHVYNSSNCLKKEYSDTLDTETFAKDKNHVFFENTIMENSDQKSNIKKTASKGLQEIEFNEIKYRAYEDKITVIKGGVEKNLFVLDQTINDKAGEIIYFIADNPKLRLSPNGNILFFDYFKGLNSCLLNGVQTDSNELLWNDEITCGAQIFWSPDNKQVAFVCNNFDRLNLKISEFKNIKSLKLIFDVNYPSEQEKTEFFWDNNEVFIFKPNKEYKKYIEESFKKSNLNFDLNEIKTR